MRSLVLTLTLLLTAATAPAQRHRLAGIDAGTPEGKLLQQIAQEPDETKKSGLMEQFLSQHAQHVGAPWVMSQLQPLYVKAGRHDQAIALGEKLLALEPLDGLSAYTNLKAAEGKKDPDLIRTWAARTSDVVRKLVTAPKPEDIDEATWRNEVDWAKQVDTYTEYSVYATALQSTDAKKTIELVEALEARNPKSQYLPQVYGRYFLAVRESAGDAKATAVAEKALAHNWANEDMLLILADGAQKQKQPDKVLLYTGQIVEMLTAKPADARRDLTLGVAHWMAGMIHAESNRYVDADKSLRAALPLVQDNKDLLGPALFYLGTANYQLAKPKKDKKLAAEAVKFSDAAAKLPGRYQAKAAANAKVIRKEFVIP